MTLSAIDITPAQWQIVRDILQKHVRDCEVWAFGSRARRTSKRYSDLYLAIITSTPMAWEVSGAMAEDFSESDLPFRVDVLDWARIDAGFRRIVEEMKVIVQQKPVTARTPPAGP